MEIIKPKLRIILVFLFPYNEDRENIKRDIEELKLLIESLGSAYVVEALHQYTRPHQQTFIGPGKIEEVQSLIIEKNIDVVVFNKTIKPRQLFNLTLKFEEKKNTIEVWDRVDLILRIFYKHAHTAEAKLQIRLAQIRHVGPRMYGMGIVLSRQRGGIGVRGLGETNLELMKRHWKKEMKKIKDQLDKQIKAKEKQLKSRKNKGLLSASIVGYTNAGKTTLFNKLTNKNKFADNFLFATLDSTVGQVYLPSLNKKIVIADTIGFIKDLPPNLIDAFRSTLIESIHADLIIHVIDISDPYLFENIKTVEEILFDLGIWRKKKVYVFNKIDLAKRGTRKKVLSRLNGVNPIFISAKNGTGLTLLIRTIERKLNYKYQKKYNNHEKGGKL